MYNGQEIKRVLKDTAKEQKKSDPYKQDVIIDPMGQWKYPGQVTKILDRNITMKGVDYPVLGVDNLGNSQMMFPGQDYTFPGQSVTEFPMVQFGGWLEDDEEDEMKRGGTLKALNRKRTSRNIKSSLNFIMARNFDIYGLAGARFYDPNAKMQKGGWLDKYE